MKIINLDEKYFDIFCVCLEDWSDEMKEAGNHKRIWFEKMKENGLRVKLALDDSDRVGGMIQYLPVKYFNVESDDNLYAITCIWVHGHKKGRGNFQKKGMGKALLEAAENDVKNLGAQGMIAWGLMLPFWMRASWFKKHGYMKSDKDGVAVLMYKAFNDNNIIIPPKWIRQKKKPSSDPARVTVTSFINGWCPAQNMVFERAKKICSEFGDRVEFKSIDTFNRDTFLEWGISDALFINDKRISNGPPLSYKKIKKKIAKQLKKNKKSN